MRLTPPPIGIRLEDLGLVLASGDAKEGRERSNNSKLGEDNHFEGVRDGGKKQRGIKERGGDVVRADNEPSGNRKKSPFVGLNLGFCRLASHNLCYVKYDFVHHGNSCNFCNEDIPDIMTVS